MREPAVTRAKVQAQYASRLSEVEAAAIRARGNATWFGAAAAVALVLAGALALHAEWWIALLPAAVGALAGQAFLKYRAEGYRCWRLKRFYQRAIDRIGGDWIGRSVTGEEFEDPDHPYARDLNVFGAGSLFELLAIGRSGIGHHGLATCLVHSGTLENTESRQEAVRGLTPRADLREKVTLLGPHEFSESKWETFERWLNSPSAEFPRALQWILPVTSALLVLIALSAGGSLLPAITAAKLAAAIVLLHALIAQPLLARVRRTIDSVNALWGETQVLREGLALLETEQWTGSRLRDLAVRARGGAASVWQLERLLGRLAARNNDALLLPSMLFLVGTQLSMAIEQWRRKHGVALRDWMEAWAEFEALNALACYAHENPENAFPEFLEGSACYEAEALGHPLLSHDTCIRNDVSLNRGRRFYVISGSNMAGKEHPVASHRTQRGAGRGRRSGACAKLAAFAPCPLREYQCCGFVAERKVQVSSRGGTAAYGAATR